MMRGCSNDAAEGAKGEAGKHEGLAAPEIGGEGDSRSQDRLTDLRRAHSQYLLMAQKRAQSTVPGQCSTSRRSTRGCRSPLR